MQLDIKLRMEALAKSEHGTGWLVPRDPMTGDYLVGKRAPGTNNAGQWGFMGGGRDEGETFSKAAAREGFEEGRVRVSEAEMHAVAANADAVWFEVFRKLSPRPTDEVSEFRWIPQHKLGSLKLHKSVKNYFTALNDIVN